MREQLKQEEERLLVISRLERLNGLRGVDGKGKGGSTGLKNTWKKLKGKKKKQRNLTAPELNSEDLKALTEAEKKKKGGTLEAVREEKGADGGKGKGLFGKRSAGKEKAHGMRKDNSAVELTFSPKASPKRVSTSDSLRMDTPSSMEDSPLSQRSDPQLSQPEDDSHAQKSALSSYSHEGAISVDSKLSPSKPGDHIILVEDLSQTSAGKLSQVSGGKLSLSQSGTFTGPDEHFSTQSSSRSGGGMNHSGDERHHESNLLPNGVHSTDHDPSADRITTPENESLAVDGDSISQLQFGSFRRGCSKMYVEYGKKEHKLNLQRVEEFLKSSGEVEPSDLSILHDWDGWVMASKDIM